MINVKVMSEKIRLPLFMGKLSTTSVMQPKYINWQNPISQLLAVIPHHSMGSSLTELIIYYIKIKITYNN